MKNIQDWEKEFYKTMLATQGGSCWECCEYEAMVKEMKKFIQKQITKAKEEGKRQGAKGLASYLDKKCDVKHYEDGTVEMLLPTTRGSFSSSAKEYLKSLEEGNEKTRK